MDTKEVYLAAACSSQKGRQTDSVDSTANHTNIKDVVKPYDWTYTTTYKGTVLRGGEFEQAEEPQVDFERLKQKEPILFYNENILYEDELADNGTTMLSIRLVSTDNCL